MLIKLETVKKSNADIINHNYENRLLKQARNN